MKARRYEIWWRVYAHAPTVWVLRFLSVLGVAGAGLSFAYLSVRLWLLSPLMLVSLAPMGALFVGVSVLRARLGAARPYELFDFAVGRAPHHATGRSFPSRHAFSACAIGVGVMAVSVPLGCMTLWLSLMMCAARFLLGVHFPRDVLVGGLVGALTGLMTLGLYPWLLTL